MNTQTVDDADTASEIPQTSRYKEIKDKIDKSITTLGGITNPSDIKKSQIAINAADARPSRFTGGERIDCAISDLDLKKRKVVLSIRLLEEIEKKEALEKYGAEGSGKNLPFSSLSEDLKKKDKK